MNLHRRGPNVNSLAKVIGGLPGLDIDLLVPDHFCADYVHLAVIIHTGNQSYHRWQRIYLSTKWNRPFIT